MIWNFVPQQISGSNHNFTEFMIFLILLLKMFIIILNAQKY